MAIMKCATTEVVWKKFSVRACKPLNWGHKRPHVSKCCAVVATPLKNPDEYYDHSRCYNRGKHGHDPRLPGWEWPQNLSIKGINVEERRNQSKRKMRDDCQSNRGQDSWSNTSHHEPRVTIQKSHDIRSKNYIYSRTTRRTWCCS